MPKDDGEGEGDEKFEVDTAALRAFANWADGKATYLNELWTNVETINILPGDQVLFPDAKNLTTTTHFHRDQLVSNISRLRAVMLEIFENARLVADAYDRAEDDNKVTAEELTTMFNDINSVLPVNAQNPQTQPPQQQPPDTQPPATEK